MPRFVDGVALLLSLTALLGAVYSGWRWATPRIKARLAERREMLERERAKDVVLFGRAAIPPNPITGEPGQAAIPPIAAAVAELAGLVRVIHHEVRPNGQTSMNDSVRRTEARVNEVGVEVAEVRSDVGEMKTRLEDGDKHFEQHDRRLAELERDLERLTPVTGT